ncbi:MAG: SDR family NAD(P)-dependent oxidoreductase [Burkholderiales bacterium]|nr:SDR family NAD(P)-dependent oxidoreductase [Burkholderiales bacterium]
MASDSRKVAIVTGSTRGIGRGIARKLSVSGAAVVINGRDQDAGNRVARELREAGGEAFFASGSVASSGDMDLLVQRAIREYGHVDMLVASAGGRASDDGRSAKTRGPFHTLDIDWIKEIVADAAAAKLVPARAVAPHMIERKRGSIVFVTSAGGIVPTPGQTAVATYAGGLVMCTKVLAKELSRYHVHVHCVAVTLVKDTPSWDFVRESGALTEHHRQQYLKIEQTAPFGLAVADDIGSIVAFLGTDEARFITGATLAATGGLTL